MACMHVSTSQGKQWNEAQGRRAGEMPLESHVRTALILRLRVTQARKEVTEDGLGVRYTETPESAKTLKSQFRKGNKGL